VGSVGKTTEKDNGLRGKRCAGGGNGAVGWEKVWGCNVGGREKDVKKKCAKWGRKKTLGEEKKGEKCKSGGKKGRGNDSRGGLSVCEACGKGNRVK